ncbi:hypothetical protein ACU4GD_16860 [Cupriavidus basilensis]
MAKYPSIAARRTISAEAESVFRAEGRRARDPARALRRKPVHATRLHARPASLDEAKADAGYDERRCFRGGAALAKEALAAAARSHPLTSPSSGSARGRARQYTEYIMDYRTVLVALGADPACASRVRMAADPGSRLWRAYYRRQRHWPGDGPDPRRRRMSLRGIWRPLSQPAAVAGCAAGRVAERNHESARAGRTVLASRGGRGNRLGRGAGSPRRRSGGDGPAGGGAGCAFARRGGGRVRAAQRRPPGLAGAGGVQAAAWRACGHRVGRAARAARAVADAMPLLLRASHVTIVGVWDDRGEPQATRSRWLACSITCSATASSPACERAEGGAGGRQLGRGQRAGSRHGGGRRLGTRACASWSWVAPRAP